MGTDNREGGVKPSQPRYCKSYSASFEPLVFDGEGARARPDA